MKTITLSGLIPLILVTASVSLEAEERMRPGLWEVISTNGSEPSSAPSRTCYTLPMVESANSPAAVLRDTTEKRAARQGCTIKEFKVEKNGLTIAKVCGSKSSVITSTYGVDTFETVDKITDAGVAKVYRMKGRRIGDCK